MVFNALICELVLTERETEQAAFTVRAFADEVQEILGGPHTSVSHQFLDGPDVRSSVEQVGLEAAPERVAARLLRDLGPSHDSFDGPLGSGDLAVVTSKLRRLVFAPSRSRPRILPSQLARRVGAAISCEVPATAQGRRIYAPRWQPVLAGIRGLGSAGRLGVTKWGPRPHPASPIRSTLTSAATASRDTRRLPARMLCGERTAPLVVRQQRKFGE